MPGGGVGLQRGVADQRQRVHLVQVQVRVDERLGDQAAVGRDRPPRRPAAVEPAGASAVTTPSAQCTSTTSPLRSRGPGDDQRRRVAVSAPGRWGGPGSR